MTTIKQKKAIKIAVENGGNISRAMLEAGYSPNTAKTPSKLTESSAFQEAMEKAGITDDYLNTCLKYDIDSKPGDRKGELELAYKLRKRLSDAPEGNKNLFIINLSEKEKEDLRKLL